MDEEMLLNMLKPYIRNSQITYTNFEKVLGFLEKKEQYEAADILSMHYIDLVDQITDADSHTEENQSLQKIEKTDVKSKASSELVVVRKVHLSNRELVRLIQNGDQQAKQDLCVKNRGLVEKEAWRLGGLLNNRLTHEDLVQIGMIGMLTAVEKFDLDAGFEFSTYALWWIRQQMYRAIMDEGFTIRVPVHVMEKILKANKLARKYVNIENRSEKIKIIAKEMFEEPETVEELFSIQSYILEHTSLDLPVKDGEGTTLYELVEPKEDQVSVEDEILAYDLHDELENILSELTTKEQEVIRQRFGLIDGREKTLEEVGEQFGVTRERIRQIESKALSKLRTKSVKRKLEIYLD